MRTIAIAAAAALALSAAATATTAGKVIGRGTSAKGSRTASVTGGADAPQVLSVRVVAKPAQRVTVTSSVICSKAGAQGSSSAPEHEMDTAMKSTTFTARAPVSRRLTLPVPHPESWCSVVVYSTLSGRGSQAVYLLAN